MTYLEVLERLKPDRKFVGCKATFRLGKDCAWHGIVTAVQITSEGGSPVDVSIYMSVESVKGSENCLKLTSGLTPPWNHRITFEYLEMLAVTDS